MQSSSGIDTLSKKDSLKPDNSNNYAGNTFQSSFYTQDFHTYRPYVVNFAISNNTLDIASNNKVETYTISGDRFYTKINPINPEVTSYTFQVIREGSDITAIKIGNVYYCQNETFRKKVVTPVTVTKEKSKQASKCYIVRQGDTWWTISKVTGVSPENLRKRNPRIKCLTINTTISY